MASKHHVLIVGAGTGGLMLAMLLERASISYQVFEKAKELKPLGSAIVITSLMHVFEQLGMKEDILAMSKPFGALHIRDETLNLKGSFFVRHPYSYDNKERYAYSEVDNIFLNRVRHFSCPLGGTFGDILDSTPKDVISKVVLENKMVPFGGQGANMAILSAVELANLLYDTESVTQEETTHVFKEYYETRHKISRIAVEQSNQNGALIHKRGILGDFARYLFLNWAPAWLIKMHADRFNDYRPQLHEKREDCAMISCIIFVFSPSCPAQHNLRFMAFKPHVLIVGAGTGGLMLALLLEKAGISYEVFEKTKVLKPLGSAIVLSSVIHIFEQMGMYDAINSLSKPFGAQRIRDEDLNLKGTFLCRHPGVDTQERYGDYNRVVARPDLIQLLLSHIPANKIHYNKRVGRIEQDNDRAVVHCQDDSSYTGTIVVGADGAYSAIRENMYKELKEKGTLPKADAQPMRCNYGCVVGVTHALDPEVYPVLKEEFCEFEAVLGTDSPFTCWYMPLTENRMGWMIIQDIRGQTCHKMLPFGAQGANMGIFSALELANRLFDMGTNSQEEITRIFEEYYEVRHKPAQWFVEYSNGVGDLLHRKGMIGHIIRYIALNWIPRPMIIKTGNFMFDYRPQANFLPFVKMRGIFTSSQRAGMPYLVKHPPLAITQHMEPRKCLQY
ncbi:hypothetical protein KVV02_001294 [Mortierella alpina]|uniref:FAD-binding domain-containing protein n=1 Tax=Mortierella alpina TaxID=64518 RepID=A0A9P8CZS6_MORAP|nr:hypothetical protein KVV02_001294 [Mortierella alpina]